MIMPNLDTANVAYQMIKVLADALPVGPILIGPARPAHILTPSVTARGILNMTAVAAVEAQERAGRQQPTLFGLAGALFDLVNNASVLSRMTSAELNFIV